METKFTHPKDASEGHEWQTCDGRRVTQVVVIEVGPGHRFVAGVCEGKPWWHDNRAVPPTPSLIDVPVTKVMWVNMYESDLVTRHDTRNSAEDVINTYRKACIRVEYMDGQFDD